MLASMPLWDAVAGLSVRVDGYALEGRELQTASGWTRVTTIAILRGEGGPRPGVSQSQLPAPEGAGF